MTAEAPSEYELDSGHRCTTHTECQVPHCMLCEGGLFLCSICGALEGALLPKCPGRRLTMDEHDVNYRHYCDYTGPFVGSRWHWRTGREEEPPR